MKGRTPDFNEKTAFIIDESIHNLKFTLLDQSNFIGHEHFGVVRIPITEIKDGVSQPEWYLFKNENGEDTADILIGFNFISQNHTHKEDCVHE